VRGIKCDHQTEGMMQQAWQLYAFLDLDDVIKRHPSSKVNQIEGKGESKGKDRESKKKNWKKILLNTVIITQI